MSKIDRRSLLVGLLAGVTLGAVAGYASGTLAEMKRAPTCVQDTSIDFTTSYAQQGEDLVVRNVLAILGIFQASYLDIGAHHPTQNSNTFLFYKAGGRGVLVEPNPAYAKMLRDERKEDAVLEVGIGVDDKPEADYYVIAGDGQRNTFSKEQADELMKRNGQGVLVKVIKRPLVNVNAILDKHFAAKAPDFVSIDVEGLDYAILQTWNFDKYRPKVFCVETTALSGDVHKGILELMESKGYAARGGSFVNTVFVDKRALEARHAKGDGHGH